MVRSDRWLRMMFDGNVNPASVDLTLGPEAKIFKWDGSFDEDGKPAIEMTVRDLSKGDFWLLPGEMGLLHSAETVICPPDKAALVLLKSSRGREGFDHAFSGWVDPGFKGNIVFEIYANAIPIKLSLGAKVVQIVYFDCEAPLRDYSHTGHYQDQTGARESYAKEVAFGCQD